MSSDISGFYKLSIDERLRIVGDFAKLSEEELEMLRRGEGLDVKRADTALQEYMHLQQLQDEVQCAQYKADVLAKDQGKEKYDVPSSTPLRGQALGPLQRYELPFSAISVSSQEEWKRMQ